MNIGNHKKLHIKLHSSNLRKMLIIELFRFNYLFSIYSYGYLTWEWHVGIRSYLYPLFISIFYKLFEYVKLDDTDLFVISIKNLINMIFLNVYLIQDLHFTFDSLFIISLCRYGFLQLF